jgi:hypothetical protein
VLVSMNIIPVDRISIPDIAYQVLLTTDRWIGGNLVYVLLLYQLVIKGYNF